MYNVIEDYQLDCIVRSVLVVASNHNKGDVIENSDPLYLQAWQGCSALLASNLNIQLLTIALPAVVLGHLVSQSISQRQPGLSERVIKSFN